MDLQVARNLLIPPVFVVLGMSSSNKSCFRVFVPLHILIVVVALVEAFFTAYYTNYFDVLKYYINTRGNSVEDFYNTESNLFISATRPGERFLISYLDLPRISSVFLEPVSLGNYLVVFAVFLLANYHLMRPELRCMLAGSLVLMLVGADSRFATVAIIGVSSIVFFWRVLPFRKAWVVLPVIIIIIYIMDVSLNLRPGTDDFQGRIANSIEVVSSISLSQLFGSSDSGASLVGVYDSGISYIIVTEGLPMLAVWWTIIFSLNYKFNRSNSIMIYGMAIYLSLSMVVSYSIASIKVASIVWFLVGFSAREVAHLKTRLTSSIRPAIR